MGSVVVDASVLVAAVLDTGSPGDWARDVVAHEHLFAPQLAPIEAAHVLRRAELAHRISSPEAAAGYRDVVDLRIELLNFEPFAERIWGTAFQPDSVRCLVRRLRRGAGRAPGHP